MSVHFTKENVFANSFLLTKQNTITYTWTKHNDMDKISEGKDPTAFLLDTTTGCACWSGIRTIALQTGIKNVCHRYLVHTHSLCLFAGQLQSELVSYHKIQRLPSNTASKYPKFFFSSKQKVVVLSIFLFSIDSFCLQRDTNSHYKDIHSCATTLQFQTLLPE